MIVLLNAGDAEVKGVETEIASRRPTVSNSRSARTGWTPRSRSSTPYREPWMRPATSSRTLPSGWSTRPRATSSRSAATRARTCSRRPLPGLAVLHGDQQPAGEPAELFDDRRAYRSARRDGRWEASIYGRNLSDELYITQAYDNYPGIFPSQYFLSEPRTYGLSVQFNYR